MWILHFLPDSFIQFVVDCILMGGAGLTLFGVLIAGWIPYVRNIKKLIALLGMLLLVAGAYFKGGYGVEMEWRAKVEEMKAKVAAAEAKAKQANTHVQTKVITKIVKVKEKAKVAKGMIQQNKEVINRECKLSDEAINAYNYSITKTKPEEKK